MTNTSENSNINQGDVPDEMKHYITQKLEQLGMKLSHAGELLIEEKEGQIYNFIVDLKKDTANISPEEKAKIESQADQLMKALEQMRSKFKEAVQTIIRDQEQKELNTRGPESEA